MIMGVFSVVAEIARWSYFIIAVLSLMNSFIHLHIQLEMHQCSDANELKDSNSDFSCIGKNLAWNDEDNFDFDTNKFVFRRVFTLQPEIFFDIWPPIILSIAAVLQHFDRFKWELISGDWGRALIFIIGWQLFSVLGYGSNFGIIIGLLGLCVVALLYLIVCIGLLFGKTDTNIRDRPVLDLNGYLSILDSFKEGNNDIVHITHENDEHHPFSRANIHKLNSDAASNNPRLSVTQPGSITMNNTIKKNKVGYNEINMNERSSDSNDYHEDLKQNEFPDTGYNQGTNVTMPNMTGCEVDSPSESENDHDGLYHQPDHGHVTPH